MIVVSGALVVVALVLLIVGIVVKGLTLVYISIAVSVVSAALLAIGVLMRRGEAAAHPVASGSATPLDEPTGGGMDAPALDPVASDVPGSAGSVLVVSGRPRYHAPGCRFVAGRSEAEEISVEEARELGFTACGVCRPDAWLTAAGAFAPSVTAIFDPVDDEEGIGASAVTVLTLDGDDEVPVDVAPVAAATGSAGRAATKTAPKAAVKTAVKASAKPAVVGSSAPAKAAAPAKAPAKAPVKRAAAASATGATRALVVVIPDRPRFHLADCRFVRNTEDTMSLTRAAATRQGYQPCGVCKP